MTRAKVIRPPKADAGIYETLSQAFRNGDIYAFSYERGTWSTWDTLHDFDATERNGHVRCDCGDKCNTHGPIDWDRDELVEWLGLDTSRRVGLTKAQLVTQLRAIAHELPPSALALLAAA